MLMLTRRLGLVLACLLASWIAPSAEPTGLYWTSDGSNTIGSANLDGTGVNQSLISGADGPEGVAVDATYVYWTNFTSETIGRANLNGTGVNQNFISTSGRPFGIVVDGSYIYFTSQGQIAGSDTISRANLTERRHRCRSLPRIARLQSRRRKRASLLAPSQAEGRGFEPRFPLQKKRGPAST
jgi:hypothetical protein